MCSLLGAEKVPWCRTFEEYLSKTSPEDVRNTLIQLPKSGPLRDEWACFLFGATKPARFDPDGRYYVWGGHFKLAHLRSAPAGSKKRTFSIPWDGSNKRLRNGDKMALCPVVSIEDMRNDISLFASVRVASTGDVSAKRKINQTYQDYERNVQLAQTGKQMLQEAQDSFVSGNDADSVLEDLSLYVSRRN